MSLYANKKINFAQEEHLTLHKRMFVLWLNWHGCIIVIENVSMDEPFKSKKFRLII